MRLAGKEGAKRICGALMVEFEDGTQGSLALDLDVSDPRAFIELQDHWHPGGSDFSGFDLHPPRQVVSRTVSIHVPSEGNEGHIMAIRLPS